MENLIRCQCVRRQLLCSPFGSCTHGLGRKLLNLVWDYVCSTSQRGENDYLLIPTTAAQKENCTAYNAQPSR